MVKLPLWFFIPSNATDNLDEVILTSIARALAENKKVILEINGKPTIIVFDGVKVRIRELHPFEYNIIF